MRNRAFLLLLGSMLACGGSSDSDDNPQTPSSSSQGGSQASAGSTQAGGKAGAASMGEAGKAGQSAASGAAGAGGSAGSGAAAGANPGGASPAGGMGGGAGNSSQGGEAGSGQGGAPQGGKGGAPQGGEAGAAGVGGEAGAAGVGGEAGAAGVGGEAGSAGAGGGPAPEKGDHAAVVWKGLHHEWLREVAGFRVPHRISKLDSYVDTEQHTFAPAWSGDALFHVGQDTGVDGNYMKPEGHFSGLAAAGLETRRGSLHFAFTDDGDGSAYPKAKSDIVGAIELALDPNEDPEQVAALRGIALDIKCDDAKQPAGEPCNSNGMWPYKIEIRLDPCFSSSGKLTCPVAATIYRAWTPNEGGLPPFEKKPFNDRLDFDLTIHYTLLSGEGVKVTHGPFVTAETMGHDKSPHKQKVVVAGAPGHQAGVSVVTAFGFELSPADSAPDSQHLGRYIGALDFVARDQAYDAAQGTLTYEQSTWVWLPDTVVDARVTSMMRVALVQLAGDGATTASGTVTGSLCSNSDGAPFFSEWKKCGGAEQGPEQTEQALPISLP